MEGRSRSVPAADFYKDLVESFPALTGSQLDILAKSLWKGLVEAYSLREYLSTLPYDPSRPSYAEVEGSQSKKIGQVQAERVLDVFARQLLWFMPATSDQPAAGARLASKTEPDKLRFGGWVPQEARDILRAFISATPETESVRVDDE